MPRSLGGKGDGQNPEQLFAMGYAGESTDIYSSHWQHLVTGASLL